MPTSVILAQIYALIFIVVGLGFLVNRKYYYKMIKKLIKNEELIFASGVAGVLFGLIAIQIHNVWQGPWEIAITLMGWLIFVKGVSLIIMLEQMHDLVKSIKFKEGVVTLIGLLYALAGLLLSFYAYF